MQLAHTPRATSTPLALPGPGCIILGFVNFLQRASFFHLESMVNGFTFIDIVLPLAGDGGAVRSGISLIVNASSIISNSAMIKQII